MSECGTYVQNKQQAIFAIWCDQGWDRRTILAKLIDSGYEPISYGRHRLSLDLKNGLVLKFPRSYKGDIVNQNEAENYLISLDQDHRYNGKLADCALVFLEKIPCILMDWVDPTQFSYEDPEWAEYFENAQVGIHPRTKEVLVYDYGDEDLSDVA